MENITTKFVDSGECTINVAEAVKQWNKDCFLAQYHEEYTLCEFAPSGDPEDISPVKKTKLLISKVQAHELIGQLDLICIPDTLFRNAKSWKKVS